MCATPGTEDLLRAQSCKTLVHSPRDIIPTRGQAAKRCFLNSISTAETVGLLQSGTPHPRACGPIRIPSRRRLDWTCSPFDPHFVRQHSSAINFSLWTFSPSAPPSATTLFWGFAHHCQSGLTQTQVRATLFVFVLSLSCVPEPSHKSPQLVPDSDLPGTQVSPHKCWGAIRVTLRWIWAPPGPCTTTNAGSDLALDQGVH